MKDHYHGYGKRRTPAYGDRDKCIRCLMRDAADEAANAQAADWIAEKQFDAGKQLALSGGKLTGYESEAFKRGYTLAHYKGVLADATRYTNGELVVVDSEGIII
jgi:hypothetical protein